MDAWCEENCVDTIVLVERLAMVAGTLGYPTIRSPGDIKNAESGVSGIRDLVTKGPRALSISEKAFR